MQHKTVAVRPVEYALRITNVLTRLVPRRRDRADRPREEEHRRRLPAAVRRSRDARQLEFAGFVAIARPAVTGIRGRRVERRCDRGERRSRPNIEYVPSPDRPGDRDGGGNEQDDQWSPSWHELAPLARGHHGERQRGGR